METLKRRRLTLFTALILKNIADKTYLNIEIIHQVENMKKKLPGTAWPRNEPIFGLKVIQVL